MSASPSGRSVVAGGTGIRTRHAPNLFEGLTADLALLLVVLAAGVGALRLTTSPATERVLLPVVASVVTGHVTVSVARRLRGWRASQLASFASGLIAVGLATVWVSVPSATRYGLPTVTTIESIFHRLDRAGALIRSRPTPLPPTAGVVLCLTVGAGLVAVLGSLLWGWASSPQRRVVPVMISLLPSFMLFSYTCVLSSDRDRVAGALSYVTTALLFLVVADRFVARRHSTSALDSRTAVQGTSSARRGHGDVTGQRVWLLGYGARDDEIGDRRRARPASRAGGTAAIGGAVFASLLLLAIAPSLSGMRLDALPFSQAQTDAVRAKTASQARIAGRSEAPSTTAPGPRPQGNRTTSSTRASQSPVAGARSVKTKGAETRPPPSSSPAGHIETVALIDNLQQILLTRSQQVMFSAKTEVPTYWQVATLSTFTGTAWLPDATTAVVASQSTSAKGTLPRSDLPSLPQPRAGATFGTEVSLAGLGGRLLPVPPTTVSVSGGGTELVDGIGALYSGSANGNSESGYSYGAVARDPAATLGSGIGAPGDFVASSSQRAKDAVPAAALAPYLALPEVPGTVVQLAHQVVAGTDGPVAEAEALVNWFQSGLFSYTLDPPQVSVTDPLSAFLFVTRAGFCQQFAGAFAVLARIDGLPTRLAVGFTVGALQSRGSVASRGNSGLGEGSDDTYKVIGADAHVWPEVYLGPEYGWVSFEPTPSTSHEPPGAGVFAGNATSAISSAQPSPATTEAPAPSSIAKHVAVPRRPPASGGSFVAVHIALLIGSAMLVAVAFALAGALLYRARRRRRPRPRWPRLIARRSKDTRDTDGEVIACFEQATRPLVKFGLGREQTQTIGEHLDRIRTGGPGTETRLCDIDGAYDAYETLARLAERAGYAQDPCSDEEVEEARRLSGICRAVAGKHAWSQRPLRGRSSLTGSR